MTDLYDYKSQANRIKVQRVKKSRHVLEYKVTWRGITWPSFFSWEEAMQKADEIARNLTANRKNRERLFGEESHA